MSNQYEELGYCEPLKAKISIDHSKQGNGDAKRFWIDQIKSKKWVEPPQWVQERIAELKKKMDCYR